MDSPLQMLAFWQTSILYYACLLLSHSTLFSPSISVCLGEILFLTLSPILFPSSFCPSLRWFSPGISAPFCLPAFPVVFFLLTVFLILIRVSFPYNISPQLTWWPPDPFLATFHFYSHSLLLPPFRFIICNSSKYMNSCVLHSSFLQ